MKRRIAIALHAFLALGFILVSQCSLSFAQTDDYDEYVREVLEEERRSYGEQYYEDPYKDPEETRKEQEARRQTEQDRLIEERNRVEAAKHPYFVSIKTRTGLDMPQCLRADIACNDLGVWHALLRLCSQGIGLDCYMKLN